MQEIMTKDIKMKDGLFARTQQSILPFEFNQDVANVFDDMIYRSVPFYKEIHALTVDLVQRYYRPGNKVFDFGCSTGTTILLLEHAFKMQQRAIEFVGVDMSIPMIEKAQEKCHQVRNVTFINQDMTNVEPKGAQIVILNYTLQFLKVDKRKSFLKKIVGALPSGGIVILSEKIISPLPHMEKCISELYHDFKEDKVIVHLKLHKKKRP